MSESLQEDRLLVERAQRGDRAALHELIRKHQERAYQYAFRLARDTDEAADVVADAFVRVASAIKRFKGDSAFTTWLYRIVTNCYLDHRKRERNRRTLSLDSSPNADEDEGTREVEDPSARPDLDAEGVQRRAVIGRALLRLPEFQRAMIILYHMEERSYEEIAESLELPLGTVKSRLNRARVSLRELLADQDDLFRGA